MIKGLILTFAGMFILYALWKFISVIWFPNSISDHSNTAESSGGGYDGHGGGD